MPHAGPGAARRRRPGAESGRRVGRTGGGAGAGAGDRPGAGGACAPYRLPCRPSRAEPAPEDLARGGRSSRHPGQGAGGSPVPTRGRRCPLPGAREGGGSGARKGRPAGHDPARPRGRGRRARRAIRPGGGRSRAGRAPLPEAIEGGLVPRVAAGIARRRLAPRGRGPRRSRPRRSKPRSGRGAPGARAPGARAPVGLGRNPGRGGPHSPSVRRGLQPRPGRGAREDRPAVRGSGRPGSPRGRRGRALEGPRGGTRGPGGGGPRGPGAADPCPASSGLRHARARQAQRHHDRAHTQENRHHECLRSLPGRTGPVPARTSSHPTARGGPIDRGCARGAGCGLRAILPGSEGLSIRRPRRRESDT